MNQITSIEITTIMHVIITIKVKMKQNDWINDKIKLNQATNINLIKRLKQKKIQSNLKQRNFQEKITVEDD